MRSPADARSDLESAARLAAVALLAVALWRLAVVAAAGAPAHHATFDGAPSARTRDSLAALARAGEVVTWDGGVSSIAAMAEGVRQPGPAVRLSVVADSIVAASDALGLLDSLNAGGSTLTLVAGGEEESASFTLAAGSTRAVVTSRETPAPARLLVIARVSWESKFVVAALEEAGWAVDTRLKLADTISVAQGSATTPSLARHSVVVVLDSVTAADAAAIARFVRGGGGLVISGRANASRALGALVAARSEREIPPESRAFIEVDPLTALPLHALAAPGADGFVLESRGTARALVASREGNGRVVQSGYGDTWRWRMEGEAGSVEAHRRWWSRLVALALPTPATAPSATSEGAPLAALVHTLGESREAVSGPTQRGPAIPLWLGASILLLLLAEWVLRRLRGVS